MGPCNLSRHQQGITGKDLRLVSLASILTRYFWLPHLKNGDTGQGLFILQLAVGKIWDDKSTKIYWASLLCYWGFRNKWTKYFSVVFKETCSSGRRIQSGYLLEFYLWEGMTCLSLKAIETVHSVQGLTNFLSGNLSTLRYHIMKH